MTITRHGNMRFKQRQKIKNKPEMERMTLLAIERGKQIQGASTSPDTKCYSFNGYYFIVTKNDERLVTVFRPNKLKTKDKKHMLDDIKIKEFSTELRYC